MKVSFSICFATLREGVERDNGDDSKDNMRVVLFWKNGRANSVEYFEYHALHLAGIGGRKHDEPPWAWEPSPSSGRTGTILLQLKPPTSPSSYLLTWFALMHDDQLMVVPSTQRSEKVTSTVRRILQASVRMSQS